jgi:hypothetical protein
MGKTFGNPPRPAGPKKNNDDDGDEKPPTPVASDLLTNVTAMAIPQLSRMVLKSFLGFTVALYLLNQKHMLPRPIGALVSKALFWPTLPITLSRRIGKWVTPVDDTGTIV